MDIFGKRKLRSFTDFNIGKYRVIMFKLIAGVYCEIARKDVKVENRQFRWNKEADFIKIDTNMIAFKDNNYNYYAFDIETGSQIAFTSKNYPKGTITIDEIDDYVNKGIIKQIVAGLEKVKPESKTAFIVVVGIMGGAIGFIAGWLIATNVNINASFSLLSNLLGVI